MRIGMTAAQNDERGDQGLARAVGKQTKKRISCDFPTWDFERRSGDSRVQTIGATQGEHGQSTEIGNKLVLYKIGVTAAPHQVFGSSNGKNP